MDNKNIIELFKNFTGIFFKGNKKNYDPVNIHANKIYFAEDTGELLLNNINYSDKPLYSISGNLNQLDISSNYNTVKEILGEYSNLLNAINLKKIIVGKTNDIENYNILYCYSDGIILTIQYIDFLNENTINEIAINITGTDYDDIIPINSITSKKINTDININNFVRKVGTTSAGAISISGTNTNPIISLLIDNINKGNVELSITEKGLIGNVNIPLKNIDINTPTSLFIKNENGTIKGKLSLDYDAENKFIRLLGFDKQPISSIDATEFIKDGMINNVKFIENPDGKPKGVYLVITFNTDAGKEPIYLNITKLIDIYTAGQGINISDNTISIKIDTSSERYISSSNDGVKIYGIDEKINNVTPYVINFNLLSKLNSNSTEEEIYNALGGTEEFSHDNLYTLLNKIITYPYIISKNNLVNIPISFTSSSGEYVIQYEYYSVYYITKIYQSLGVFKVKVESFNNSQFTVLEESIKKVNDKASQVYENLAAIEASGETNPNKIYIDGETMQPYVYKAGEFVPFKGGNVVQDPNNIPFYTCRYDDEFAVPINEDDLTDVIVFRKRYGTNVERIKNGKSVWKKAVSDIYLNYNQNYKLNQTLFVVDGYLYFRSKPYGVYKFSLEDGTFINNRTDIHDCEAICYLNGNIYAVGDTNKLVVLNKDDLSLVSSTELDANLTYPYLNSYEDRCIILLDKKAVVVKQDGETQEFTFDVHPACGFYIPRTTYINAPFYVFYSNEQIHTISEDLQYNFKSNINNGAIDGALIGTISDLTQYITYGEWESICFIGERGCYICKIPGNNPITSILFTALNINSNINKDNTIGWYDCFYKTKSGEYIVKRNNTMYKVYSLI